MTCSQIPKLGNWVQIKYDSKTKTSLEAYI